MKALARGERGLVDPFKKHKARALTGHVADYPADVQSLGRDDKYVYDVGKRLDKLLDLCGWRVLADVSADSFGRWRERPTVRRGADAEDGRVGLRTRNQYLEAARTFLNWAVKRGRLAANPLAGVEKVDETADVRRARRALTVDQLGVGNRRATGTIPSHLLVVCVACVPGGHVCWHVNPQSG